MHDQETTTRVFYFEREAMRPTAKAWMMHGGLLLITLLTATIAGTLYPFGSIPIFPEDDPRSWGEALDLLISLPAKYAGLIFFAAGSLFSDWQLLLRGFSFSGSLLFILISHEMGHYVACRRYRVDATLPYFIPTPPLVGPAGTFGAFIKILSPMPSRKAVFDIGVAGPIAGFIALIPIAILGVLHATPAPPEQMGNFSGIIFTDPLLMKAIGWAAGIDLSASFGNPFYYAAWVGLLVTALNLIPSGQLDGGHAIYAVFGARVHYWTGRIAFVLMAVLSVLGLIFFNSPSGFLIAILLGIMMRIPHPQPWDESPLDGGRKIVAVFVLLMFAVCFVPFPIKIV